MASPRILSRGPVKSRLARLREALIKMERVAVAFSGGVDSAFLLKTAADLMPGRVFALSAVSVLVPPGDLEGAKAIAAQIQVPHHLVDYAPLDVPGFADNPRDRCYACKTAMLRLLLAKAKDLGATHLVDGTNADDMREFRPGLKALSELAVRSPLCEVGLGKAEIRDISREIGLVNWDKPSSTCLATRFPYGETITMDAVETVGKAEAFLHSLGYRPVRVRWRGGAASIEIDPGRIKRFMEEDRAHDITDRLRRLGLRTVTLDMEGYVSGKLDRE